VQRRDVYYEPTPMPREEAEAALESGDPNAVIHALLRSAYHNPDARWIQEQCLRCVRDPEWQVRHMAALGFSHLARLHGARALDLGRVLPVLLELLDDPQVGGTAQDVLTDLKTWGALRGRKGARALAALRRWNYLHASRDKPATGDEYAGTGKHSSGGRQRWTSSTSATRTASLSC
jgi:hypothetical protein